MTASAPLFGAACRGLPISGRLHHQRRRSAARRRDRIDRVLDVRMRGVVARGASRFSAGAATLRPRQRRAAGLSHPSARQGRSVANVDAQAFAMALINEYRPGAPIGWHRDTPQYGMVAGISLLSSCRMKFRRYLPPRINRHRRVADAPPRPILLERRSAYLMTGESRSAYEHHIPAVTALRYSITFRTVRG